METDNPETLGNICKIDGITYIGGFNGISPSLTCATAKEIYFTIIDEVGLGQTITLETKDEKGPYLLISKWDRQKDYRDLIKDELAKKSIEVKDSTLDEIFNPLEERLLEVLIDRNVD